MKIRENLILKSITELQKNFKKSHILVIQVPERRKGTKKKTFEEIMGQTFPNLMKSIILQTGDQLIKRI